MAILHDGVEEGVATCVVCLVLLATNSGDGAEEEEVEQLLLGE